MEKRSSSPQPVPAEPHTTMADYKMPLSPSVEGYDHSAPAAQKISVSPANAGRSPSTTQTNTEVFVAVRVRPESEVLKARPTSARQKGTPKRKASQKADSAGTRCLNVYGEEGVLECIGAAESSSGRASSVPQQGAAEGSVNETNRFSFDTIFDESTTQGDIMDVVGQRAVDRVLEGYHGTVLTYGQSGCGKTHTMVGPQGGQLGTNAVRKLEADYQFDDDVGLLPRMVHYLLQRLTNNKIDEGEQQPHVNGGAAEDHSTTWSVSMSAVELYNEEFRDLIPTPISSIRRRRTTKVDNLDIKTPRTTRSNKDEPRTPLLQLRQPKPEDNDFNVSVRLDGLRAHSINSFAEAMRGIHQALQQRRMGSTELNINSNRAHTLYFFNVLQRDTLTGSAKHSVLTLVDLAGSERVSQTGAEGQRLKEAQNINLSLSQLSIVIRRLTSKNPGHIPFRNSKLTRILSDCFGGNAITFLLCGVSPDSSDAQETLSTLRFARTAKQIKNKPILNQKALLSYADNEELVAMRLENQRLRSELENAHAYIAWLEQQLDNSAGRYKLPLRTTNGKSAKKMYDAAESSDDLVSGRSDVDGIAMQMHYAQECVTIARDLHEECNAHAETYNSLQLAQFHLEQRDAEARAREERLRALEIALEEANIIRAAGRSTIPNHHNTGSNGSTPLLEYQPAFQARQSGMINGANRQLTSRREVMSASPEAVDGRANGSGIVPAFVGGNFLNSYGFAVSEEYSLRTARQHGAELQNMIRGNSVSTSINNNNDNSSGGDDAVLFECEDVAPLDRNGSPQPQKPSWGNGLWNGLRLAASLVRGDEDKFTDGGNGVAAVAAGNRQSAAA